MIVTIALGIMVAGLACLVVALDARVHMLAREVQRLGAAGAQLSQATGILVEREMKRQSSGWPVVGASGPEVVR